MLLLLLVLAVLGAVAVVAAGWGDGLAPSARRPGPRSELPPDPRADDLDRLRFAVGLRGYRMDEVDEVLDRLREELRIRDERIAALQARLHDEGVGEITQDQPAPNPPAAERGI